MSHFHSGTKMSHSVKEAGKSFRTLKRHAHWLVHVYPSTLWRMRHHVVCRYMYLHSLQRSPCAVRNFTFGKYFWMQSRGSLPRNRGLPCRPPLLWHISVPALQLPLEAKMQKYATAVFFGSVYAKCSTLDLPYENGWQLWMPRSKPVLPRFSRAPLCWS